MTGGRARGYIQVFETSHVLCRCLREPFDPTNGTLSDRRYTALACARHCACALAPRVTEKTQEQARTVFRIRSKLEFAVTRGGAHSV